MTVKQTLARIVPDDLLKFRGTGQVALTADTNTPALALDELVSYWASGDIAINQDFLVVIGVTAVDTALSQNYKFSLVTDSVEDFGDAPITLVDYNFNTVGIFELGVSREQLRQFDDDANFLRVQLDVTSGYQSGTVTFTGVAQEGDKVRINDSVHGNDDFLFGTYESGSFAIGATMAAGDKLTVNDGTHSIQFAWVASGASGHNANIGISATESAQNMKAAIAAAVVALGLDVTLSGASTTITIKNHANFTGGTISEDVDSGNHMTVTNFSGGVAGLVPGVTASDSAAALAAGIPGASDSVVVASVVGAVVTIVNHQVAPGSAGGSISEVVDGAGHITVVDWTNVANSVAFWAYAAPAPGC